MSTSSRISRQSTTNNRTLVFEAGSSPIWLVSRLSKVRFSKVTTQAVAGLVSFKGKGHAMAFFLLGLRAVYVVTATWAVQRALSHVLLLVSRHESLRKDSWFSCALLQRILGVVGRCRAEYGALGRTKAHYGGLRRTTAHQDTSKLRGKKPSCCCVRNSMVFNGPKRPNGPIGERKRFKSNSNDIFDWLKSVNLTMFTISTITLNNSQFRRKD